VQCYHPDGRQHELCELGPGVFPCICSRYSG
jgi:hypothetical protein